METAAQLSHLLQRGKCDPVELTERVLGHFSAVPDKAIAIELLRDRALAEARAARRRLRAGWPASVFDGIPIGWKALFDVEGHVTTAGSALFKSNTPATADAALVHAARAAGLVSTALLNMTEFAFSALGLNPHFGMPHNAKSGAQAHVPGGSSSASAVAVARGLLPLAIGTDTGGSVRIPASFNGIVGYKSSTGHYPMRGVFPLSKTYDTLGPFAQTVEDCALLDGVLRGNKHPRPRKASVKGRILYVPDTVVMDALEPAVAANFERALSRISRAGAKVKHISFPPFEKMASLIGKHGNIILAEAYHLHAARVNGPDAGRIDQRVVARIRQGEKMSSYDLLEVQAARAQLIAEADMLLSDGFAVFPTTPITAPSLAAVENDVEAFTRMNLLSLRNTSPGNFFDWCGLSIPSGEDEKGMPTGFQLSTSHGRDAELLALGLSLEPLVRG